MVVQPGPPDDAPVGSDVLSQFMAITGLPCQEATTRIQASSGSLQVALDEFFREGDVNSTLQLGGARSAAVPTPPASVNGPASAPHRQQIPLPANLISTNPSSPQMMNALKNILRCVWGMLGGFWIFCASLIPATSRPAISDSFNGALQECLLADEPIGEQRHVEFQNLPLSGSNIHDVMSLAEKAIKPVCLMVIDQPLLKNAHAAPIRRLVGNFMAVSSLRELVTSKCALYGFNSGTSLSTKLLTRVLQLTPGGAFHVSILLPLVFDGSLLSEIRLALGQEVGPIREGISSSIFGPTPSTSRNFSRGEQQAIFSALQTRWVELASGMDISTHCSLKLLRGGVLQTFQTCLSCDSGKSVEDVVADLTSAINLADFLLEPVRLKRREEQLKRLQDRELRELQESEYQASLAADRERERQAREEEAAAEAARKAELEREQKQREEEEAFERKRSADALEMLSASPSGIQLSSSPEDFAQIVVRVFPSSHRLRFRVHKDVLFGTFSRAVAVADLLAPSTAVTLVIYSSDQSPQVAACQLEDEAGLSAPSITLPKRSHLVSQLQSAPFRPESTMAECQLLPNAVLHLIADP